MNPLILFDNILAEGTLAVTSTATGYSINNIADYRSYTKWKAANTNTQNIDLTGISADGAAGYVRAQTGWYIKLQNNALLQKVSGTVEAADAIGIFNHNLGTIHATVKVQYWDGAAFQTAETLTPTDDDPILETFTTQSATKWRIEISNCSAAAEIAVIFLGAQLEIPDSPDAPTVPVEEGIAVNSEYSEAGNLLGSTPSHFPININHQWTKAPNITRTWYSTYFIPFWENHARDIYPFFYAWDLTNRPDDIRYVTINPGMSRREVLSLLTYSDELVLQMKGVSGQ